MEQLEGEAAQRGCGAGALALAWVLEHAQVTSVICGPSRRAEYLELARRAIAIELDEPARNRIGSWFKTDG